MTTIEEGSPTTSEKPSWYELGEIHASNTTRVGKILSLPGDPELHISEVAHWLEKIYRPIAAAREEIFWQTIKDTDGPVERVAVRQRRSPDAPDVASPWHVAVTKTGTLILTKDLSELKFVQDDVNHVFRIDGIDGLDEYQLADAEILPSSLIKLDDQWSNSRGDSPSAEVVEVSHYGALDIRVQDISKEGVIALGVSTANDKEVSLTIGKEQEHYKGRLGRVLEFGADGRLVEYKEPQKTEDNEEKRPGIITVHLDTEEYGRRNLKQKVGEDVSFVRKL